jgi:MFS family permease
VRSTGLAAPAGPLRERPYRYWFLSQILSSAGVQTQNIAAAWIVFAQTHSGVALAMLVVATQAPGLLLGAFAGSLLDRVRRRHALLVSQGVLLLVSAALAWVTWGGHAPLGALFALSAVTGVVNAVDAPARQVIVVDYVGLGQLGRAVSLYEVSLSLARTAGPAIGGVTLALLGPAACFLFNAVTFVAPVAVLLFLPPTRTHTGDAGSRKKSSGFRALSYAVRSGPILATLLFAVVVGCVSMPSAYMPQFAQEAIKLESTGYGTIVACLGLGALPGALVAARIPTGKLPRAVGLSGLASATAITLLALAPGAVFAYVGAVLAGATAICLVAMANTLAQSLAPTALRGGIMGVWTMAIPGMSPVTSAVLGVAVDHAGPRSAIALIAVAMTAVTVGSWRSVSRAGVAVTGEFGGDTAVPATID